MSDDQIELIANLFSSSEQVILDGFDTEWLLSHAFQKGAKFMKSYYECGNNYKICKTDPKTGELVEVYNG